MKEWKFIWQDAIYAKLAEIQLHNNFCGIFLHVSEFVQLNFLNWKSKLLLNVGSIWLEKWLLDYYKDPTLFIWEIAFGWIFNMLYIFCPIIVSIGKSKLLYLFLKYRVLKWKKWILSWTFMTRLWNDEQWFTVDNPVFLSTTEYRTTWIIEKVSITTGWIDQNSFHQCLEVLIF